MDRVRRHVTDGVSRHGKDNKLSVWKLRVEDEDGLNCTLPADDAVTERRQPWLLHMLHVNTLNFCAFAMCEAQVIIAVEGEKEADIDGAATLIAVPNALTSEAVDIFHLPSGKRIHTVPGDKATNTGMVMAVSIFHQDEILTLIVGYESGHVMVTQETLQQGWQISYLSQPHKQPVLSLDVLPNQTAFLTSSADAIIAKHPIPPPPICPRQSIPSTTISAPKQGTFLASEPSATPTTQSPTMPPPRQTTPLKQQQTKHSGQQSLTIRSDAKIFATAGWDSKVRVYSTPSMKEVAVLKWHAEGVYAVALAVVARDDGGAKGARYTEQGGDDGAKQMVKSETGPSLSFREKRIRKAETTHWLAAGSKDGKVSLWDIY